LLGSGNPPAAEEGSGDGSTVAPGAECTGIMNESTEIKTTFLFGLWASE